MRGSWQLRIQRHGGPVAVWLVAVVSVLMMVSQRVTTIEAPGLVRGRSVQISPVEAGLLASLEVSLLQEVQRGQVLARMDEERLRAEAAVVAAEVEAVRCELALDMEGRRQDLVTERRRFANDVEDKRLEMLEIMAVLEPDRVTLADLHRDVVSYQELLAQELVSVREFERVQAEHDALARRVQDHEQLLAAARSDLALAEARREEFVLAHADEITSEGTAAAAALSARVTALQRRLEAVLLRCHDLALTAPFGGVVTQIPACPGQVVQPGEAVVTLAEAAPAEIVVWLDEASVRQLQGTSELQAMEVQATADQQMQAHCPVAHIGPVVETMPPELWPAPDLPTRGRPVVLGIPAGLKLVPGEQVTVRWS